MGPKLRLLLAFALLLAAASARAEMQVYHPKHRAAQDLVPLVEVALGADGRVAVDPHSNALVLIGSASGLAQALELLAIQDRRLRTVLIQHETRTASELATSGARVAWGAGGSGLRVGNVERGPESSGVAVRLRQGVRSGSGSEVGMVRVLEGEWARIASGTEMLLPIGSHHHPDAVRVAAESGLEVRPRVLGDGRVRLDLRPFQGALRPDGTVAHAGADTTLVVTPGETAVVGGLGGVRSTQSRSLLSGGGHGQQAQDRLLLVTVSLDDDAAAEAR
jgi:Flp pilus assembly secretin CpaC